MARSPSVLDLWRRLSGQPAGRWLFGRLVCRRAPYFGTIRPRFRELRPGYCEVELPRRRAVLNHIGTVHAIAMCNAAELSAGVMTEATIPATHRWIPKGMSVEYLRRAETSLRSIATLEPIPAFGAATEVPVPVKVVDERGDTVLQAEIRMWISPRRAAEPAA